MRRQKDIELAFLEEARRSSSIFPPGRPIEHERPDFLFPNGTSTLGVEVTELCREAPRAEGERLANVAPRAEALFAKRSNGKQVHVSPVFSNDAARMKVGVLAQSLADFVYAHRDDNASFEWPDVPGGYIHIGVFPAVDPPGRWLYFKGGDTVPAPKELIESRIAEKSSRLSEYRKTASEVWLLILNDLFLGAGEVCLRDEDLTQWTFKHDFDKVLVFERQPGGAGWVIELRRN